MQALLQLINRLMQLNKKSRFSGFFIFKRILFILMIAYLSGCEPALEHLPEQQLMDKAQQGNGAAGKSACCSRFFASSTAAAPLPC